MEATLQEHQTRLQRLERVTLQEHENRLQRLERDLQLLERANQDLAGATRELSDRLEGALERLRKP